MNKVTPNDIEVLLHFYVSPDKHPRDGTPAVYSSINMWCNHRMLIWSVEDDTYTTTDKGKAHILQLLNLPFPKKLWIGVDGMTINLGD